MPLGYEPAQTLAVTLALPQQRYPTSALRQSFYDRLLDDARALPGVIGAARTTMLPPQGGITFGQVQIDGGDINGAAGPRMYSHGVVSHNCFDVMRIPLVAGRIFSDVDGRTTTPVLVINETMAGKLGPGESAVGKRIALGEENRPQWLTIVGIVGIVGDVKAAGIRSAGPHADYQIYQTDRQPPTAGAGVIAGIIGSMALTRLLSSLLFEVSSTDSLTFAVVITTVLAVSVASTVLPGGGRTAGCGRHLPF